MQLETAEPGRVSMYVCGPTVYGFAHVGNARTFVWFDMIRRYLIYRGFDVTYVLNYTDVDDKIIDRARLEKITPEELARDCGRAFEQDMAALGVRPPDILCKATDHIAEMVNAIEGLVDKEFAYEADGDVFFAIERFAGYGSLSHRSIDDLRAGERIEPRASKRHPLDFALWKSAKEDEPSWSSPWGPGRPGWHIECSAMSVKYLGMGFDIHGGGSDLIFPHHENEIAQAEALNASKPFARHWMHSGMVQMESEKMSKSLGNVVVAHDVLARLPGEVVRYWALSSSYRSQVLFSEPVLHDAEQGYARWKTFFDAARYALGDEFPVRPGAPVRRVGEEGDGLVARFIESLDEDFNSARAFATIHDLVREGNKHLDATQRGDTEARATLIDATATFLELTSVLGFSFTDTNAEGTGLRDQLIEYLLELRTEARGEQAFERADAIRVRLSDMGVVIEDTASGPRWRVSDEGR